MILHVAAAGVPISWSVTSVYRDSLGVAVAAAKTWYDRHPPEADAPQAVIQMLGSDDAGWTVGRTELLMSDRHLSKQRPDDPAFLLQTHTAPFPMSDALGEAVAATLRDLLVSFGYLVPRAEWTRRYPAQVLISRRFADFREACDAARETGADLAFEDRWIPFMDEPPGRVLPYRSEGGMIVPIGPSGDAGPPLLHPVLPEGETDAAVRLLNSGWSLAETIVLLTPEPVEPA